jgi:hypothetical protein
LKLSPLPLYPFDSPTISIFLPDYPRILQLATMGKHLTMSYGHLAHTGYELYNQGPGNVRRPSTTGYDIRFGQGRWLVSNTGIGKGSVQHCLDFSFVFSAHLPTRRNLFSASGILCSGKYQPRSTGISSLSLLLKSEKIPALLYLGKGPEYRPF